MENDLFGDWRISAVLTLGKDISSAFPGGPSHKAGAPIYLSHSAKTGKNGVTGFITPDASALALNNSFQSAEKAMSIKKKISYKDIITPWGKGTSVTEETTSDLYDYFENFMITVIFSFLAVEAYANALISYDPNAFFNIGGKKQMRAYEIEKCLSTDEKIKVILPLIKKINIPFTDPIWQNFMVLKQVRDTIVHLKYKDLFSNANNLDNDSLYFHFLNKEPINYPRYGYDVIQFFEHDKKNRWMEHFEQKYVDYANKNEK
jgi:hypothetical protein